MQLKPGVKIDKLQPQALLGIVVVNSIFEREHWPELVITAGNDSVHKKGSLHYVGQAFDIRTRDLIQNQVKEAYLTEQIRGSLGVDFDVVLEKDHAHIEYDPKS